MFDEFQDLEKAINVEPKFATSMLIVSMNLAAKNSIVDVLWASKEMDMKAVKEPQQACKLYQYVFQKITFRFVHVGTTQDCRLTQNCHHNAKCDFDDEEGSYACICNYGFIGNGFVCRSNEQQEQTCLTDANICSSQAECVSSGPNFECQCLPGYKGDGITCSLENKNTAVCAFGVCVCAKGYILGSLNVCEENEGELDKVQAIPQCYGNACACPKGYIYSEDDLSCNFDFIPIPAEDVHCDKFGFQCGPNAKCIYEPTQDHSTCQCNKGYIGDGFECEPFNAIQSGWSECKRHSQCYPNEKCVVIFENSQFVFKCKTRDPSEISGGLTEDIETTTPEPVADLCQSNADCHENADCIYKTTERRYVCQCRNHYEGDGYMFCDPSADAGCDITKDCDVNANCRYNEGRHQCICNDGFQGNGKVCEKVVIGCNILNNCATYAFCDFNALEGGYRCHCDTSRGFEGDGLYCKSVVGCNINPLVCDPNADCTAIQGTFGCQCRHGFLGDGHTCQPVPIYEGNTIISSQGMALMKLSLDTRQKGIPIFVKSFMTAAGLDVDCFKGKLYWSDTTGSSIMRANYNGSNAQVFLTAKDGLQFPEGIAVDWLSRNIYWADSGKRTIEAANLESGGKVILIDEQLKNPRGVAVDPTSSKLFWSDWDRDYPRIECSNLDGTDRKVLVDALIAMPNSLTVDFETRKLCWTDGGGSEIGPKIGT